MRGYYIHLTTGYRMVLETDELGYIVASCPDLPGCWSQGDSIQEALLNIDDAIMSILAVIKEEHGQVPISADISIPEKPMAPREPGYSVTAVTSATGPLPISWQQKAA